MGEAKRRGTYEQRVAQAQAEHKQESDEYTREEFLASLSYRDGIQQHNIWVLQDAVKKIQEDK